MWADRELVESRIHALVADFFDYRDDDDDEFDLGVFALVAEVKTKKTPEEIANTREERKRPEAGYTPEAEWFHSVTYRCSDGRTWINSGLFEQAKRVSSGF